MAIDIADGQMSSFVLIVADIVAVACVEVYEDPAWCENAEPFRICTLRFRQCPSEIARDYGVKAFVGKVERLCVHYLKPCTDIKLVCKSLCLAYHCREQYGKISRTRADIKNAKLSFRKQPVKLVAPALAELIMYLIAAYDAEVVRTHGPVVQDPFFHLFHIVTFPRLHMQPLGSLFLCRATPSDTE